MYKGMEAWVELLKREGRPGVASEEVIVAT